MKSKLQKILSVFLSLALVFGVMPGSLPAAFAEGTPTSTGWSIAPANDAWMTSMGTQFYGGAGKVTVEGNTVTFANLDAELVQRPMTGDNKFVAVNVGVKFIAPDDTWTADNTYYKTGSTEGDFKTVSAGKLDTATENKKFEVFVWWVVYDSIIKEVLRSNNGVIEKTIRFANNENGMSAEEFKVHIDVNNLTFKDESEKVLISELSNYYDESRTFLKIENGKITVENGVAPYIKVDSEETGITVGKTGKDAIKKGEALSTIDLNDSSNGIANKVLNGKTAYAITYSGTSLWKYETNGALNRHLCLGRSFG